MKIWVMLFTLALFAGGACLGVAVDRNYLAPQPPRAGSPGGRHRRAEISVTDFVHQLSLTEEQDRDLDLILGETQRDVEAYNRAIRDRHERSRERVMALLTADQKKKLDEIKAAEDRKRSEEELNRSLRFYTRLLELDEARAAAVRQVLAELRDKKRDFFRNERHGEDYSQIRPFLRDLKEEQGRRFQAILTSEQFKRYQEFEEWEH
jgi:Spy/CpxP family protein refolding chaperone